MRTWRGQECVCMFAVHGERRTMTTVMGNKIHQLHRLLASSKPWSRSTLASIQ